MCVCVCVRTCGHARACVGVFVRMEGGWGREGMVDLTKLLLRKDRPEQTG